MASATLDGVTILQSQNQDVFEIATILFMLTSGAYLKEHNQIRNKRV